MNYNKLHDFLSNLVQKPFFKAHDDYNFDKISNILVDMTTYDANEYKGIVWLNKINFEFCFLSLTDSYQNCVCICITGLHQILTRYPQHYRALNRLAHFYANFVNDKVYDFSSGVNKLGLFFLFSKGVGIC
jgi:hypothetical protein